MIPWIAGEVSFDRKAQILSQLISGGIPYLYVPEAFKDLWLDIAHRLLKSGTINGCGPKGYLENLVPDVVLGVKFVIARMVHDYMYDSDYHDWIGEKKSIEHKNNADKIFLGNLTRLVINTPIKWYVPFKKTLYNKRLKAAAYYYKKVKLHGGPAYWK